MPLEPAVARRTAPRRKSIAEQTISQRVFAWRRRADPLEPRGMYVCGVTVRRIEELRAQIEVDALA